MLEPYRDILDKLNIVLASGSPRRKEILEQIGLKFSCQESDYDERELNPTNFDTKSAYVTTLAQMKIRHLKIADLPDLIIGADTIVVCEDEIYGKPGSLAKAAETLRKLSGKTHEVFTGVALKWSNSFPPGTSQSESDVRRNDIECFSTRTLVKIAELSEADIDAYIRTGEPLDKAGAYGIQGLGGSFVEWINGDYYNVMGFPMHDFCKHVTCRLEGQRNVMKI